MKAAGLVCSGQYGFAPTDMYWKALGYAGDPRTTKR